MDCPVCWNKWANCDCSQSAIRLHLENEELRSQLSASLVEIDRLKEELIESSDIIDAKTE